MHWARLDAIARAVASLVARQAYLDGEDWMARPLIDRKRRLAGLLANANRSLHYSDLNASMRPTRPAIAACGARSNVCTARNAVGWTA
jgi:hypothetical protein